MYHSQNKSLKSLSPCTKPKSEAEETVSLKSYIKGFEKARPSASVKSLASKQSFSITRFNPNSRVVSLEIEKVGEEGTAQIIRSPIVKRGKSSNQSVDLNQSLKASDPRQLAEVKNLEHENKYLLKENILLKNQLKIMQNSLNDSKHKLDQSLKVSEVLRENNTELVMQNKKLHQEVDRLVTMINMFEAESCRSSQAGFQDDLEAKILSLDKEKEEKYEMYQSTMFKLISYLNEFISCEEWIISLVYSPLRHKELLENEDLLKTRLERLQNELYFCQSQIKTERYNDKSYFTSMSSSVNPSPLLSPKPTLRSSEYNQLKFSN